MSDDRTKADKAWEARQEAARYRIFNAATNAAEATDEADDENYLQSWTKRATLPKLLPRRSPGTRFTPTCWRRWTHAANSPSAAHTANVGKLPDLLRRLSK